MIDTKLENAIQKLDDTFTKQKSIANKLVEEHKHLKNLLSKVKEWLKDEMSIHDDNTDEVSCGRYNCAEQLLMFINRKEKE